MTGMSAMQHFQVSRSKFENYPCNLIRTDQFQYDLEQYKATLDAGGCGAFAPKKPKICFWTLSDTASDFQSTDKVDDKDLSVLLSDARPDPICEFGFIYSATSRSALMCSREQLQQILTHHQVMAPFLDFVFTFRAREEPQTLAALRIEDWLHDSTSAFTMPEMERSGHRIQHCFNLIAVEHDAAQVEWPWPLRQTAAYHSFDVGNGRTFWLSLKGNSEVSKRLKRSVPAHPLLRPSALETPEARFTAALLTHLIIFHWCVENWPQYNTFLQRKVKEAVDGVRFGPVTAMSLPDRIKAEAARRRGQTSDMRWARRIASAPQQSAVQEKNLFQVPRSLKAISELLFKEERRKSSEPQQPTGERFDLDFDQLYNFDQVQKLEVLREMVQQSLVVIGQNINVIKEIMARYQSLAISTEFNKHINGKECQAGLETFLSRSQQLIRGMENNALGLENMLISLGSAKDQVSTGAISDTILPDILRRGKFYGILQYRNTKTSEYFAQSAHDSSKLMEHMAIKTKQETVSMHSITILTLVFLPGTFLATVFGSGILRWNEEGGNWDMREPGLNLFLAICIPMTAFTLGVWIFWTWWSKKRQREDFWRSVEEGILVSDEKRTAKVSTV